jgi:hypothetical protein
VPYKFLKQVYSLIAIILAFSSYFSIFIKINLIFLVSKFSQALNILFGF